MKASDVMTTTVVTISPDTPVADIATLMLERHISGVPVVDAERRVVGMVSEGDLIRRPEIETDRPRKGWLRFFVSSEDKARDFVKTHGVCARDIMARNVVYVSPEATLAEVVKEMDSNRIKRVPVIHDHKLVGLITRTDLLRALHKREALPREALPHSDQEIRGAIQALLRDEDWAAGVIVNAQVSDGVVHLWGVVDSDEQKQALVLAVERLPGVKSVEPHLGRTFVG